MTPKINKELIATHVLDIGNVYFYNNFVVTEINEGITLTFEKSAGLMLLAKKYYGNKVPFAYISNRVHSYSFQPTAHYQSTKLFPNLIGFAVVSYGSISNEIASLEQAFVNVPKNIFTNLEDAIEWVNQLIIQD
ncbi:hypothetical protein U6A24_03470 [Aquimarina gracilis]|uniref:SpoIIAA-like protein n=1 Tax=Aquimarina gracilis TaxID=874422 RepID=A0ABU5ZR25_9FLAO|nr:hypothetical protein [Aquimarina gracilis]MEB3344503.1 hypothetical protein [Aquimarina gracilis]